MYPIFGTAQMSSDKVGFGVPFASFELVWDLLASSNGTFGGLGKTTLFLHRVH